MIAFQMMVKGIQRLLNEGKVGDPESLNRKLKVFETVSDFTQEDCNILYDSGVFNDITIAYALRALQEIGLGDRQNELSEMIKELFNTTNATDILN